jgi:peptidoglycan hydrolase-like protein with peptidoglycan-binding domain
MIRRPRAGLLRAIAVSSLAAAACLGLAACGSDSGSVGSPASTPATVTATTAGTTPQTTVAGATADPITRSLQEDLGKLGFYDGPVNGEFDAATTAAVKTFQESAGLPQDGIAGAQTHLAIDFELGRSSSQTVELLQRDLAALCQYSGPVNGVFTSATEAAVTEFQKDVGLTADGQFGPQTAVALIREGEFRPSSCASTPATAAATHTGPAKPAATVSVRGPSYDKTFEVVRCTPKGETGVDLAATGSGGFTLRINVSGGQGTLVIGGGSEQDGIRLRGAVDELSVGDAGDIRGSGVFTPPRPDGPADFTIAGRCA